MNVAFIVGLFPKENIHEILEYSKGPVQFAADALQWSFVNGLKEQVNLKVINLPYVGAYPFYYKKLYLKQFYFGCNENLDAISLGYNNLFIFKNISKVTHAMRELEKWVLNTEGDKVILVYGIHSPFLFTARKIKEKYPQVKICNIVPDLPEYMSGNDTVVMKSLKKINKIIIDNSSKYIESYVLLSEHMTEKLDVNDKKWIQIEGMYNPDDSDIVKNKYNISNSKTILYSGTLDKRYGIVNLLDAFNCIKHNNVQLIICGDGDAKHEIVKRQKLDSRIIYKGQLLRNEILELQNNVTLLVNPRTADGEFTKYSFPSKTMEYLASGTPTLIYKLQGIPNEYYNYCFTLDDTSVLGLSKKIEEIIFLPESQLNEIGIRARNFILKYKNPRQQCEKLIRMLEQLF